MTRQTRYSPEVRARAVRMVLKHRGEHAQHRGRYGTPRIHAALGAEGDTVSRGRIERLMRRHGLRGVAARRSCPVTTDSRHGLPVAPNLLGQEFDASRPNQVWLADITYVLTGEGWLYLAAALDLATRKVVEPRRSTDCRPSEDRIERAALDGSCAIICAPNWPPRPC